MPGTGQAAITLHQLCGYRRFLAATKLHRQYTRVKNFPLLSKVEWPEQAITGSSQVK